MKQNRLLTITIVIALSLTACDQPTDPPQFGLNGNGNGFPAGGHYQLNLIGVRNDKEAAMEASNEQGIGRRIFVRLYFQDDTDGTCFSGACPVDMRTTERTNKIILEPGEWGVFDANATDANGARFRLPATVSTSWYVYARPLGKPGERDEVWAKLTTCGTVLTDPDPLVTGDEFEEVVCSLNSYMAFREKGRTSATEVTDKLFFVDVTLDATATDSLSTCLLAEGFTAGTANVPLFDPCFQTVFWDYDNHGLKLLQLRFYPRRVS